jgi:O-antigen ligase
MLLGPVLALYLTYGRGAQLGALVVIAFIATVKFRKIWLYALPFIVVGAFILPNTFLWDRLISGFRLEDQATRMRLDEYANALAILERHPLFGVGFGDAPSIDLTVGASMIYLTLTTKMGLFGLTAFFLVIGLFFRFVFQNLGKLPEKYQQANLLGLTAGIVGVLVVGIFDHYFFNIEYSHLAALMWLFIALAVAQVKIQERGEAKLNDENLQKRL